MPSPTNETTVPSQSSRKSRIASGRTMPRRATRLIGGAYRRRPSIDRGTEPSAPGRRSSLRGTDAGRTRLHPTPTESEERNTMGCLIVLMALIGPRVALLFHVDLHRPGRPGLRQLRAPPDRIDLPAVDDVRVRPRLQPEPGRRRVVPRVGVRGARAPHRPRVVHVRREEPPFVVIGAPRGIRTPDLLIRSQTLYPD